MYSVQFFSWTQKSDYPIAHFTELHGIIKGIEFEIILHGKKED
ncbi:MULTISPECIES: hypothetical protein [Acinetobacter]